MNEILKKALNRGAPIETPVFVEISDLLNIVNSNVLTEEYKNNMYPIICEISNLCDMYTGNFMIPTMATITTNEDNVKTLSFTGFNYHYAIANLIKGSVLDSKNNKGILWDVCETEEGFKKFKDDVLSITSENDLKRKYPMIYHYYEEEKECAQNLMDLEEYINDKRVPLNDKLVAIGSLNSNFKKFWPNYDYKKEMERHKNFSVEGYLKTFMNGLEIIFQNREEIIELYASKQLELNSISEYDSDAINLYIAKCFMDFIQVGFDDDKQRYLFYLTNYFKENVEEKVTRVKIKVDNKKVTPISLYEQYKQLLIAEPELLAVNFQPTDFKDMTKEEIEEFIKAFLVDLSANWKLLPPEDNTVDEAVKTSVSRKYRKLTPEERKEKQEKLIKLYVEKRNFFDSTDPYFRIRGEGTYEGYVGYIYSNSVVILEKYYDNEEKKKLAQGDAIYVLNMQDFYELSRYSKTHLIANHLCNRVYHRGNWQEKVLKYINRETNLSPVSPTNDLLKKKLIMINDSTDKKENKEDM